ncbi:MAG: hypothetical protein HY880_06475 [Deltaproteobacteria bacterium]|nr:hypothetical protein [Deltaproteobacteria bacterium]
MTLGLLVMLSMFISTGCGKKEEAPQPATKAPAMETAPAPEATAPVEGGATAPAEGGEAMHIEGMHEKGK